MSNIWNTATGRRAMGGLSGALGIVCILGWRASAATAATFSVVNASTGNWSAPGTWDLNSGYPNATVDVAQGNFSNSTSGGNITTRTTTLDVNATVNTLQLVNTGTWTINAAGSNKLTLQASSGSAILGRTSNNSNAGLLTVNPNTLLGSNLLLINAAGTSASTSNGVVVNGSIANASGTPIANIVIQQGNNTGQAQGGRRIVLAGMVDNTGSITFTRKSSTTSTGDVILSGGIGGNVTGLVTTTGNSSKIVLSNTMVFDLGTLPDTISHNGGVLDISSLTLSFNGPTPLSSYVLLDYSGGTGTLLTATNPLTDNTFAAVLNLPTGASIVNDTLNKRVMLAIPEPASLALLGLGGLLLLSRRQRM